jgi:hypothetical protein
MTTTPAMAEAPAHAMPEATAVVTKAVTVFVVPA